MSNLITLPAVPHLKKLDLYQCELITLQGMPGYEELQYLNLRFNQLTTSDLNVLPDAYPQLKILDLTSNNRTGVNALAKCDSLEELNLGSNNIQYGIKTLENLKKLKNLSLVGNYKIPCGDLAYLNSQLPITSIETNGCTP